MLFHVVELSVIVIDVLVGYVTCVSCLTCREPSRLTLLFETGVNRFNIAIVLNTLVTLHVQYFSKCVNHFVEQIF